MKKNFVVILTLVLLILLASFLICSNVEFCLFPQGFLSNQINKNTNQADSLKDAKTKLQGLLPENSYIRDYQRLEGVTPDSYLVLYLDDGYEFNEWDLSCPGMILGKSIAGNYRLSLLQNMKIINTVDIPNVYQGSNLELVYKDIFKYYDYDEHKISVDEKDIPVEKLIDLKDYTGDGLEYEFLLTTTGGGCGFYDGLVAGYDPWEDKVTLFSDWIASLNPDSSGYFYYLFECGNHGNMTRTERKYQFNSDSKKYELIWEKEAPCEIR